MDSAAFRIALVLVVLTVVFAEAVNEETAPRTRRSTYLGFPRLGRGYLALPRMGRSSPSGQDAMGFERNSRGYLALPRMGRASHSESQSEADSGSDAAAAACCKMGLKKEWQMAEDGKMTPTDVCQTGEFCCPGMEEVQDTKPDGSFYTMCVPRCRQNGEAASHNVMLKLRQMLTN